MPLRVEKLFLEPRTWIGNTGLVPLQPIDQAAWIWHPDAGPGPDASAKDEAPVFLRFRRDFKAAEPPLVLPDGGDGRLFTTHWWRSGRYCLLEVKAGETPLTIRRLALDEARYPLENEGAFECGDQELGPVIRIAVRGLQMCSHETFMDCPYYEQLMYVGDTRLEMLTTYVVSRDDRLVRRGIEPQPGPLPRIESCVPHPDGFIRLDLSFEGTSCSGKVELPEGVAGVFVWKGREIDLAGGRRDIESAER